MAEPLGIKPNSSKVFLYRLYSLITDGGVLVYRKVFTDYARQMSGSVSDHIDNYRTDIERSFLQGGINRKQFDRLFPSGNPVNSVENCDLTLLAFLVRISCVEDTGDISLRQQIAGVDKLRRFRNEITHIHSTEEYGKSRFEKFWQRIKIEILILGQGIPGLEEEIDALKDQPIDPEREAELQQLMEDLRRRATVAEDLANRMTKLENNQNSLDQRIDKNHTTIIAKMKDEADAREHNQNDLMNQLLQINKNPFLQLPSPGDFSLDSGVSISLNASHDSSSLHCEQMRQYKQSDGHITHVVTYHQVLTQGTVTAFVKSDYEDLSKAIGSEWPTVADHLGLSKSQIERIKANFEGNENQAYIEEMVQIWVEMKPELATID